MKQDVLGTVRNLIRLAAESSPENIEEARNAALQACKLIHKHALLDPSTGTRTRPPARAAADSVPPATIEDLFADLFGNKQPTRHGGSRTRAPAAPPPPQPTVTVRTKRPVDPDAKDIPVLDPAWCGSCHQRILRGRFATWSRGQLYHPQCWKNETET